MAALSIPYGHMPQLVGSDEGRCGPPRIRNWISGRSRPLSPLSEQGGARLSNHYSMFYICHLGRMTVGARLECPCARWLHMSVL